MDLCDPAIEAAAAWLSRRFLFSPEKKDLLTWRVPTDEVYRKYRQWVSRTKLRAIPIEEIWGIIQLVYPFVEIVGTRGNRAYTSMREHDGSE